MSGPQIILWVIALAVLALCIRRGVPQAKRAVVETNRGFWRILPMFCVALPMAAFLSELVPADIATEWLGDDSGLSGILIASLAGGVMPGGPFVTFPLVITFSKAGAGVAQMTALGALMLHFPEVWIHASVWLAAAFTFVSGVVYLGVTMRMLSTVE